MVTQKHGLQNLIYAKNSLQLSFFYFRKDQHDDLLKFVRGVKTLDSLGPIGKCQRPTDSAGGDLRAKIKYPVTGITHKTT